MQHFYHKLHTAKQGQTAYHSLLTQLTKASQAEIKRIGWYSWGP